MNKYAFCLYCLSAVATFAGTFADTVARFEALGMPSVAGAEFANVQHTSGYVSRNGLYFGDGIINLGACGNAWKLTEEGGDGGGRTATFIVNGAEPLRVTGRNDYDDDRSWEERRHKIPDGATSGVWEKARLKRATLQIMQMIDDYAENMKLTKKQRDEIRYGTNYHAKEITLADDEYSGDFTVSPEQVMLYAIQLHQYGETADAEAVAAKLAGIFGAEKLEESARIALAESLYFAAFWRFCADRDLARFNGDVKKVMSDSPESWKWLPDLREMTERLDYAVRGELSPLPDGYDFTEEERVLIRALEAFPEPYTDPDSEFHRMSPGWRNKTQNLWLVPEAWMGKVELSSQAEHDIRVLGLKAFPMLIALCGEYPANLKNEDEYSFSMSFSGSNINSNGLLPFPHPALRAEKALRILQNSLPRIVVDAGQNRRGIFDDGDDVENAKLTIRDLAAAFYDKHRDSTPGALALEYLVFSDGGNSFEGGTNKKVFDWIREKSRLAAVPEFEEHVKTAGLGTPCRSEGFHAFELARHVVCYASNRNDAQMPKDYADRLDAHAGAVGKIKNYHYNAETMRKDVGKIQGAMGWLANELRNLKLDLADGELWDLFANAEPMPEICVESGFTGMPAALALLEARLDAVPFVEMYAETLRRADPDKPQGHVRLLARRIETEGGTQKIGKLLSQTHMRDEWRSLLNGGDNEQAVDLYGELFDREYAKYENRAYNTFYFEWEYHDDAGDDDDGEAKRSLEAKYQAQREARDKAYKEHCDSVNAFWKERFLARLDAVPENELPGLPWRMKKDL